MAVNRKSKLALYTENAGNLFDEIVLDFYNKHYCYNGNIDKRELVRMGDDKIKEFLVDNDFFYTLFGIVKQLYSGEYWVEEMDYDFRMETGKEYDKKQAQRPIVPKEEVWRALRGELSRKELKKVRSNDVQFERDDYYDVDLYISMVRALMKGKITVGYFTHWCAVFMECLDSMSCDNKELLSVYENMICYIDGAVFDGAYFDDNKFRESKKMIAYLKHYDHLIRDLKSGKQTDFTTNDVVTYISFGFSVGNGGTSLYRVCIVDNKRKTINYMLAPGENYSEGINYTFLSEAEFDDLSSRYHNGYALDTSMGPKYAAKPKR